MHTHKQMLTQMYTHTTHTTHITHSINTTLPLLTQFLKLSLHPHTPSSPSNYARQQPTVELGYSEQNSIIFDIFRQKLRCFVFKPLLVKMFHSTINRDTIYTDLNGQQFELISAGYVPVEDFFHVSHLFGCFSGYRTINKNDNCNFISYLINNRP